MKYYKHITTNEVYAYESEQEREEWGAADLVEMTQSQIDAHLSQPAQPYVPQQVTRAQGKAALITSGLWSDVESYVDGITDPTERQLAEVALHDTTHWRRDSPFLNSAAAALGLTDEDLDNLFIQASEIEL